MDRKIQDDYDRNQSRSLEYQLQQKARELRPTSARDQSSYYMTPRPPIPMTRVPSEDDLPRSQFIDLSGNSNSPPSDDMWHFLVQTWRRCWRWLGLKWRTFVQYVLGSPNTEENGGKNV